MANRLLRALTVHTDWNYTDLQTICYFTNAIVNAKHFVTSFDV